MSTVAFQVTGANTKAPFTLKVHRGDGMALLAMNWRDGKPPRDFVGFAIEFREPSGDRFWPIKNRIGFPGQRTKSSDPPIESTKAPIQKFRWVHFPRNAEKPGKFTYRVTAIGEYLTSLNIGFVTESVEAIKRAVAGGSGIGCLSRLSQRLVSSCRNPGTLRSQ